MEKKLAEFITRFQLLEESELSRARQHQIAALEDEYQTWFLSSIISETEEILALDPSQPTRKILELAAKLIVKHLFADAATIRIIEPDDMRMTSFGAYGVSNYDRLASVPLKESISGLVVQQKKAIAVPDIFEHPLFKDKTIVKARGFHSLLAVPLFNPVPMLATGEDLLGTMQIYYKEKGRKFTDLEITHAELLSRRISFVLAKKKILDLQKLNRRKETIINNIFFKLSRREGIKLKDLFILLVPELDEMLGVQGCSLLTVSDDRQHIHLEASYPSDVNYYEANYSYTVSHHPYFQAAISGTKSIGDGKYERITPSYILVKNPIKSSLISDRLHDLVKEHNIHSILFVPLKVVGEVRHLMIFFATRHRQAFTEEEVELITFFGKEIMKASKLEFLDDVLHDIKNPAIALAGFSNRVLKLMENENLEDVRSKLTSYVEIMASEAARMQDLAQAMSGSGREEELNLAAILRQRVSIFREVVYESKLQHVELHEPDLEENLVVYCPRYGLERILDNLLSNAIKAVPKKGGSVRIQGFLDNDMVTLIVENSGEISQEHLENIKNAQVRGRGLNIISRFVTANHGNMDIEARKGSTRIVITLPRAQC
ncbi:MAG: GAF domain-containing protein [Proteobacteria bacterium]|nr:GAF domain-containing protein [Pseudomonadota bacterium]MBU1710739.1 GAF domain-containing protein [Pseudomonadota bacterium]